MAALEVVTGRAAGRRRRRLVAVQREEEVGRRAVGGVGARVQRHALVRLARELHAAALGAQQFRQPQAQGERHVLLGQSLGGDAAGVAAAVSRVDGHGLAGEAAGGGVAAVALGDLLALASRLGLAYRLELPERALADDAVGREPGVALEVQHGALDLLVVHPSLGAGVEAQQVELDLELQHVVAAERRLAQVQQAVAERVAGFHHLAPGVGAHMPVGEQAALLLERKDRGLGVGAVEAVHTFSAQLEALPAQAGLDVEDFFAAVAA